MAKVNLHQKTNKFISLAFFFILISCTTNAQELRKLSGQVTDDQNRFLASSTISILHPKDSSILHSVLTNEEGKFEMEFSSQPSYLLSASMISYKKQFLLVDSKDLATPVTFRLIRNNSKMEEVKITARKPLIEQKIDRTVVNVDALLSNSGVSALEVLENSPGVSVDQNSGSISLRGKNGVVIFIDDKPTYLSGSDLANYLRSLPSATLEKIEIMTNPPARYDAAGNAGVINIRTKKNRARGFQGSLSLGYNQGRLPRSTNNLNLNYREGKFNVFGTLGYTLNNGFNDLDIYRYYLHPNGQLRSTFFQHSDIRRKSHAGNARLGVDYALNSKTTMGILLNGILRPSNEHTLNTSTVRNETGLTDSVITADNAQKNNWRNGSINLNLLHQFNTGRSVSFDLDYVGYRSRQDQIFQNAIYAPNGDLKSKDGLTGDLPSDIYIYSAKADYSHAFANAGKIEGGAKISQVTTDNAANYFIQFNGSTTPDYDKTNHFKYQELIQAAYLNYQRNFSRFSLQSGLRLERTVSDGHQLGNSVKPDSTFRRSYTQAFPTLYILYKLDSQSRHQVGFNYGRRIDRPVYQDLNPFISPLDKFSIYVGNPYLRPTITNSFELSHIYKNRITTTLSYSFTDDVIQETIDLSNSVYVSRPANIGKSSVLGLNINATLHPFSWWTNNITLDVQKRHYEGLLYNYYMDTSRYYFGTNLTSQFNLGKGWTAELGGFYRTDVLVGQIISGETGQFNIGAGKKLFQNKGSLKLNFRDVFYTRINKGVISSIRNAYATYRNWFDTQMIGLTFSYSFGKNGSGPRNRSSATEAEQNRVR